MPPKFFLATKAFIVRGGKVLIVRESPKYPDGTQAGKYGEVGGRLEPGEEFEASLLREIREEAGLQAKIGKPFYVSEWWPEVRGEKWQIVAIFFECFSETGDIHLGPDHDDFLWIDPKEYKKYPLIENLPKVFEAYNAMKQGQ
jgi:8-oxo-dGTP diphosphatase